MMAQRACNLLHRVNAGTHGLRTPFIEELAGPSGRVVIPELLESFFEQVGAEELVARFRPFLEALVVSDLSPKIIQRHVDNIWALGGEIIRDLNENPSLRRKGLEQILDDRIDEEGGPLVYALESEEPLQRSLDSTCRKLYRFLRQSQR